MTENDKKIIEIAYDTDVLSSAFEQLYNRCDTDEARSMLHTIEMSKWHKHEREEEY